MNSTDRIAHLQGFYQAYGINKEAQLPMGLTVDDFGGHPPGKDWDMGNLTDEQTQTTRKWKPSISWVGDKPIPSEEVARRNQGLDDAEYAASQGVPYAQQYIERNQRPPQVYKPAGAVSHAIANPVDALHARISNGSFLKSPEYMQMEKDRVAGEFRRALATNDIETVRKLWNVQTVRDEAGPEFNKNIKDFYDAETTKQKSRLKNWAIGAGVAAAVGIPLAMFAAGGKTTADPRVAGLAEQLSKRNDPRAIDYDAKGNVIVNKMKSLRLSDGDKGKSWPSILPSSLLKEVSEGVKKRLDQGNSKGPVKPAAPPSKPLPWEAS